MHTFYVRTLGNFNLKQPFEAYFGNHHIRKERYPDHVTLKTCLLQLLLMLQ